MFQVIIDYHSKLSLIQHPIQLIDTWTKMSMKETIGHEKSAPGSFTTLGKRILKQKKQGVYHGG